jgi:hypothetical protein
LILPYEKPKNALKASIARFISLFVKTGDGSKKVNRTDSFLVFDFFQSPITCPFATMVGRKMPLLETALL